MSRIARLTLTGCALLALLATGCASHHHADSTPYVKPAQDQSFDAAIDSFRAQHEKDPNDLNALLGLSRNLRYAGHGERAVAVLKDARGAFGDDPTFLAELGKANLAAGRPAEARDALARALEKGNATWQTYSALGVANDLQQSYPDARDAYDHALAMCPDSAPILNNKALSVAYTGDIDSAIKLLQQSFRMEPRSNRIATNLAALQTLRANCSDCSAETMRDFARSVYPYDWTAAGDGPACDPHRLLASDIVNALTSSSFVDLRVNFAFDSAELLPAAKEALDELGRALSTDKLTAYRFRLEGHTDAVGTDDYNLSLSKRRAQAVKAYLSGPLRLEASRLDVEGFGESRLLDAQHPTSGVNRRVRVVRIDPQTEAPGPVSSATPDAMR